VGNACFEVGQVCEGDLVRRAPYLRVPGDVDQLDGEPDAVAVA